MTLIIGSTCTACGACIVTCPERALRRAPRRPELLVKRCTNCLACIEICPTDAIRELARGPRAIRELAR